MQDMPRPRPPYLEKIVSRSGDVFWYVRRSRASKRIRIRAEYGSLEFQAEYEAALAGQPIPKRGEARSGSLKWLLTRYRETTAWQSLSPATRRQRENIFRHVIKSAGDEPFVRITKSVIASGRDRRHNTPSQARNFLDAMRGMFRWACEAGHVKIDPTADVKNPPRHKGGGFPEWTEDDLLAYEARWPVGTKERLWLHVLLYTGGRRGDSVRIGRQHVRDGSLYFVTEKTETPVIIPLLAPLKATIDVCPHGDLTFICGARGLPLTKESFGNMFSSAARAAGVKKSAHGVRKVAATRCAEAGATIHELNAIFGWNGTTMAMHYTKLAERKRLAAGAAEKMIGTK